MKTIISILMILSFFFYLVSGCDETDKCKTETKQCNENLVEICGTDHIWYTYEDCDEFLDLNNLELTFKCVETSTDNAECKPNEM